MAMLKEEFEKKVCKCIHFTGIESGTKTSS